LYKHIVHNNILCAPLSLRAKKTKREATPLVLAASGGDDQGGNFALPLINCCPKKKKKNKQTKKRGVDPLATISMVITMKVTMNVVGNDKGGGPFSLS